MDSTRDQEQHKPFVDREDKISQFKTLPNSHKMSRKQRAHIALLMMVKNEEKRLHVSLESVKDTVNSMVIFDTGSTDKTIEILKEFSKKSKIPLRLKEGEFVNFSTSRNVALDFADTFPDIDYCLLLDCNDELRDGGELRKWADKELISDRTCYLVCQEWWSGKLDKYYNTRLLKVRNGWRYKGSVHEWISKEGEPNYNFARMPDNIVLYQDRTKDDDKTSKRFDRDKVLLLKDYKEDPKNTRTLFYLAQTCSCLKDMDDAYYYYKLRSELDGFQEEKFHSYLRLGDISAGLGHPWSDSLGWYMKSAEHSLRAEPLVKIAAYYRAKEKWQLAHMFSRKACSLSYPDHCILFVDKQAYDYNRWHLLGIVSYYAAVSEQGKINYKTLEDGKAACMKAITEKGHPIDRNNLLFYLKRERELQEKEKPLTRKEFIEKRKAEIKHQNTK